MDRGLLHIACCVVGMVILMAGLMAFGHGLRAY